MIDAREQARQIRTHLRAIDELTGHGRKRGLTKGETEHVQRLANAARAHLTSLEIATGIRPLGAAIVAGDEAARG